MGINQQLLVGNLGDDPEIRATQGGQTVCNLRLAVTVQVQRKGEDPEDRTSWHDVVVWGRMAEACKGLRKGAHVCVVGETRTRSYDDRDGNKRYRTEVTASFIGAPLDGGDERGSRDEGRREERGRDDRRDDRREQRQGRDDRGNGRRDDDRGSRDDRRPPRDDRGRGRDAGTPFG